MTYIIKSNVAMKNPANAVGNIHGYQGASDYRVMLNFSQNIFISDGKKLELTDVVGVSQSSITNSLNIFKEKVAFAANTPRIGFMPSLNEMGLVIEAAAQNFLTSETSTSFVAANASERLCLSWSGTGNITISTSDSIALGTRVVAYDRTYQFYARTGQVTGTLSKTGDVKDIMVNNSDVALNFIDYGKSKDVDVVKLKQSIANIISSGSGTILCRFVLSPDNKDTLSSFYVSAFNGNAKAGGLLLSTSYRDNRIVESILYSYADNAAKNANYKMASVLGSKPVVTVAAMSFSGYGAAANLLVQGQASIGTATSSQKPTAFTDIYVGASPDGMLSKIYPANGLLTHCVIYDRKLSETELQNSGFFGS